MIDPALYEEATKAVGISPEELVKQLHKEGFTFKRSYGEPPYCSGCALTAMAIRAGFKQKMIDSEADTRALDDALWYDTRQLALMLKPLTPMQIDSVEVGYMRWRRTLWTSNTFVQYGAAIREFAEMEQLVC